MNRIVSFIALPVLAVSLGCGGAQQQTQTTTPPPPQSSTTPALAGAWQIVLTSSNTSNTNTVIEANLTQSTVNDPGTANTQNFYVFGLAPGSTQIDGSPLTVGGQCGQSASDNISLTLSSFTLVSGNPGTVADANVQLSFSVNGFTFTGAGSGVVGTGDTIGRGAQLSGSYSSSGACTDTGTWTAVGNLQSAGGNSGQMQTGSLPSTALLEPYSGQFCAGGAYLQAAWTNHGPITLQNGSPQQTFAATFECNGWALQYIAPGKIVGNVGILSAGQKTEFPLSGGQTSLVGNFTWLVFSVVNPTTYATTLYAYNTDGTFVTNFDGTCSDIGSGCN